MGSTATHGETLRSGGHGSVADSTGATECRIVNFGWRLLSIAGAGALGFCFLVSQFIGDDDDGEVSDPLASPVSSFAVVAG